MPAPPPSPEAPAPVAAPTSAEPAEPEFDPASLPPVESLTAESDISAFLRAEVPVALRRAALRRIWTLDPAIRDFVGPADYAWDYNAPDGVPGFSLELGGDAQKLLAQAIGLGEPEPGDEAPPADAGEVRPADVASSPAPPGPPAEAAAPEVPPLPILAAGTEAPPDTVPAAPPVPVRRHGGATPA